jgi:hypothetical protein
MLVVRLHMTRAGRQKRRPQARRPASNRQGWRAVRVVGVETAGAVGAEQVGHPHSGLAQDQFQVAALALGTNLSDSAESLYVKRLPFIVDMVDDHARIELAENQTVFRFRVAAARWFGVLLGWRHRFRYG